MFVLAGDGGHFVDVETLPGNLGVWLSRRCQSRGAVPQPESSRVRIRLGNELTCLIPIGRRQVGLEYRAPGCTEEEQHHRQRTGTSDNDTFQASTLTAPPRHGPADAVPTERSIGVG
jgi:hypothetical protein